MASTQTIYIIMVVASSYHAHQTEPSAWLPFYFWYQRFNHVRFQLRCNFKYVLIFLSAGSMLAIQVNYSRNVICNRCKIYLPTIDDWKKLQAQIHYQNKSEQENACQQLLQGANANGNNDVLTKQINLYIIYVLRSLSYVST